ncbi:MAG TPA: cystathionine beta-lyase [Candidatus Limnocylindrales bacterium]
MNDGRFRTPNPEIRRASTVLFDDIASLRQALRGWRAGDRGYSTYGTHGTPTTAELERLLLAGEGGAGVELAASGLGAIAVAMLAVLRSGDHLLATDAAYGPARELCSDLLTGLGVDVEFYDPLVGGEIGALIRPATRLIWLESPGTHTFEVQDVPAIVAAAHAADHPVVTAIDNTWGSPGLFRPFDHGVDVSVVALTKYWGGHADLLMGAVFANEALLPRVRDAARLTGTAVSAEDAFLVTRGARTVDLRIREAGERALAIAERLAGHPRVARVLHPALPGDPGHALWQRDFHGASGLFSFELRRTSDSPADQADADAVTDRLVARGRFGLGYSWGGFESLVIPARWSGLTRTVRPWAGGPLLRLSIGLEPIEELWADLEAALAEG